ncbi:MAG: phytanoyl-CoA dioxygenase family protein [Dehalococcoidia bacterium]
MAAIDRPLETAAALSEQFRKDGVVFLKRALDQQSLDLLRGVYEYDMSHPSPGARKVYPETGATFHIDTFNQANWPAFKEAVDRTPVADIVSALWGVPEVWFFYEQVFLKEGGDMRRTPWHQDSSYLPVDGDHQAVVWITFDAVSRENALEFIPGSHRGKQYNTSAFDPADDTAPGIANAALERLPDIEAARSEWEIRGWDYEPGDLLVFHMGMLHGGAPTRAGGRRRTVSLRFFGPDAVYQPRTVPSDDADEQERAAVASFAAGMKPGQPFRSPIFPKVRPLPSTGW